MGNLIKKQYQYRAFGMNINSEMCFPELISSFHENQEKDISIVKDPNLVEQDDVKCNPFYHAVENRTVSFYVPEIAYFQVSNGREIRWKPYSETNNDVVKLFLLGTCMGIILMHHKIIPLHGSAVEINGEVLAVVGDQGAGKSTTVAQLIKMGCKIVSDDIIPVKIIGNKPYITPTYPQQKLWEDSLIYIGREVEEFQPIYGRERKYNVPVREHFIKDTLPLKMIFELTKDEVNDIETQTISPLPSLNILFKHTYRNFLIKRLNLMEYHFHVSSLIFNNVKMYRIIRPENESTRTEIAKQIIQNWEWRANNE
ncbi:aldolase [Bacillus carboniphilus]|uniref:Aldolase n=1 Tax=Bacillus carboniphilus TaxID=86663 RepID=A0ABY9JTQ6_9BACI|nr:aldolase [Bacillus carboniphilus]WLR42774.1 aldolase [Bacillus carboniphilus]